MDEDGDGANAPAALHGAAKPSLAGDIPFVGRERELDRILSEVVTAGRRIAIVTGPSGSGKSRLLAEVPARSGVPSVMARALPAERHQAWGLARSFLRELLSLDIRAADRVPELAATALREVLPELAEARSISPHPIDAQSRRPLIMEGAVRLTSAVAEGRLLALIDDVQWADASSLDILQLIAQRVKELRLVVAKRPEEVTAHGVAGVFLTGLQQVARPVELRLGPLDAAAIAALFEDERLIAAVVEESDRSPLALAEYIQSLTEQGAIEARQAGRWRARPTTTLQMIRDAARTGQRRAVTARVARLPATRREVLNLLALLGRQAPARLLAQAAVIGEADALVELDALARGRLARFDERGWATAHDFIAETIGDLLTAEQRALLHARVARVLRADGADPAEAARHLAGAGDRSAAANAFAEAARRALERFANQEAAMLVEQALALQPGRADRQTALEVRAEALARSGRLLEARDDLREALSLTVVKTVRARLLARLAMLTLGSQDELRAAQLAESALTEAGGDVQARAEAMTVGAIVDLNVNRLQRSQQRFDQALALFQRCGNAQGTAAVLDGRAMAAFLSGRVRESAEAFEQAADLFADSGRLLASVSPRASRAHALVKMACPEQACTDGARALDLARSLRHPEGICWSLLHHTLALTAFGQLDEARAAAEEALTVAEHLGHRAWIIMSHHRLGVVWAAAGDLGRAEDAYRHGLALADRVPFHWSNCANALARVLIVRAELDSAESLIARSLADGLPISAHDSRLAQAELLAARGDPAAGPLARRALDLAEQSGYLAAVPRLRTLSEMFPTAERPGVTARELAVLRLLAEGLTAAAIGRRLGISPRTVTKHQENLYRKLDATDRVTAIITAQKAGLLPHPAALSG